MNFFSLKTFLAFIILISLFSSCNQINGLCELPEADQALKNALKLKMTKWQKNADYQNWENFEPDINQVIDELNIVENNLHRRAKENCHCLAKIQFANHSTFMEALNEPVKNIKATEHPMNSAYLRMEEQISYLENDGFEFFYTINQEADSSLTVYQKYYLVMQPQIDDMGKMMWDYLEYQYEK